MTSPARTRLYCSTGSGSWWNPVYITVDVNWWINVYELPVACRHTCVSENINNLECNKINCISLQIPAFWYFDICVQTLMQIFHSPHTFSREICLASLLLMQHGLLWDSELATLFTNMNTWISNYPYYTLWNEITHPFPNFRGCCSQVSEWISTLCWACDGISLPRLKV